MDSYNKIFLLIASFFSGADTLSGLYMIGQNNLRAVPRQLQLSRILPAWSADNIGNRGTYSALDLFTGVTISHFSRFVPSQPVRPISSPRILGESRTCITPSDGRVNSQSQINFDKDRSGAGTSGSSQIAMDGEAIFGEDLQTAGPNPYLDARANSLQSWTGTSGYQSTATTTASSKSVTVASAMTNLKAGQGVLILGAGAATTAGTPSTPTIKNIQAKHMFGSAKNVTQPTGGSNIYCTKIYAVDQHYGYSASSSEACTTTSWPLGVNSILATSWSRSGTTITAKVTCGSGTGTNCNASNVPALSVGAEVCIAGGSNTLEFGGCYEVSGTGTSSISFATQASASNGSSTSARGTATLSWYNGVEVSYANVTGTQWQYVIGLGTSSGKEVKTGISLPQPSSTWDAITLDWDYFGSTISGLTTFPFYLPSSMPSSAGADALITTCTANCDMTTITVANAATTAVSGTFITLDNSTALNTTNITAASVGGMYIPAPSSSSACYPVYGPVTITSGVLQQGNICAYGTIWMQKGVWNGSISVQNQGQADFPSFVMDAGHIQIIGEGAYPVFIVGNYTSGQTAMSNTTISTSTQNNSLALYDVNTGKHNFDRMGLTCGTAYSGICYYNLPSSSALGFGVTFTNSYILAQGEPSMSQSFAPAIILKNSGENKFANIFLEGRGVLLSYDGSTGGIGLTWDMQAEQEGGISMFDIDSTAITGQVNILNPIQDTIAAPLVVGYAPFVGITCFNCAGSDGYPVVSGIFGPLTFSGPTGAGTTQQVGANTEVQLTAPNLNQYTTGLYRGTGNANLGLGQIANPQVAPTVTATTSCFQFPPAGTYTYTVVFYDYLSTGIGVDNTLPSPGTHISINGSNCASVVQPTPPAGAAYWTIFRNGFQAAANAATCGLVPISTTTILDENRSLCGASSPGQNTTAISGIAAAHGIFPAISMISEPAPTGNPGFTSLYMDSTAKWPSFKANGNTPYVIPGVSGSIVNGHNLCASGTNGAYVDCLATKKIASGTAILGTSPISAKTCATVVTSSAAGVDPTDVISYSFNAAPSGAYTAGLFIQSYVTPGNVSFLVCNPTASSLTPAAATLNWRVNR